MALFTRVIRWISRLPAEPLPGVLALLPVKVRYAFSSSFSSGPAYDAYASTRSFSSGPIEWTLDGVQGFTVFTSVYVSSCVIWVCAFLLLVLLKQEQGRHVWREGVFCNRLVVPGPVSSVRCPVSAWSCHHHVRQLSPFLHVCMLRRTLRSRCSSCTAPDLSANLLERERKTPDVDIGW